MVKLKVIIISIFLICTFDVHTQNVEGTVLDFNSNPVSYAIVCKTDKQVCTRSDQEGRFVLDVQLDDTITISNIGYVTKTFVVTNQNTVYKLEETVTELDAVVIEGQSIEEEIEEQGFAVDVIELENLQGQSIELNQILDQSAGVKVRQEGGLGSKSNFTINGLSDKSVRFFLDGVPMDYFGSSYSINTIPVSLIDRIDVYKGVVPIEFGNDALGGVINLVTKTDFENSVEVAYSYGSFNTHRTSLLANWRDSLSGVAIKTSAFYNYSDNNYKVWGDDIYVTDLNTYEIQRGLEVERFHDAFQSKAVKFDVGLTEKKWADQLFVGLLYSQMDKEIQHGVTMEIPFGEATYNQHVVMPNLTYKKYDFLIDKLYLNMFSGYSLLSRMRVDTSRNRYNWYGEIEGFRNGEGEQSRSLNTLTDNVFINRINLTYDLKPNHKIGLNFISNHIVRSDEDPLITTTDKGFLSDQFLNKQILGLAYQNNLLNDKFKNSLFIKGYNYGATVKDSETIIGETTYFDIDVNDFNIGYGFASSYKLNDRLLIKGSLEKAIRLPDTEEVFGDGLNIISSSTLPDGVELKPEKSINVNLGTQATIIKKDRHTLELSSNVFYRNTTDLIMQKAPNQNTNINTYVYINIGKVEFKGLNANLVYKYNKAINVSQNVSYLIPTVKTEEDEFGVSNVTYNTRLPNTPFFQTNTSVQYNKPNFIQKKSSLMIYWDISYVAEFFRNTEIIGNRESKDVIPAQLVNNMGVGYVFPSKKLSISVDVRNIFNEQVFDNFAIQKPGRAAYVKLKYRLVK